MEAKDSKDVQEICDLLKRDFPYAAVALRIIAHRDAEHGFKALAAFFADIANLFPESKNYLDSINDMSAALMRGKFVQDFNNKESNKALQDLFEKLSASSKKFKDKEARELYVDLIRCSNQLVYKRNKLSSADVAVLSLQLKETAYQFLHKISANKRQKDIADTLSKEKIGNSLLIAGAMIFIAAFISKNSLFLVLGTLLVIFALMALPKK